LATAVIEPMPRQWSPPSRIGMRPAASSAPTASITTRFQSDDFLQVPVAVVRRLPRIARAIEVAAIDHVDAARGERFGRPAMRSASGRGPHRDDRRRCRSARPGD
jgi:hypothetical protein